MNLNEIEMDYKLLQIKSEAFPANGPIPTKYTCEGEDINPPIEIHNIPSNAKSLALIMLDPDAPGGTWTHWVVWNIPITHYIGENEIPGEQGENDFGKVNYGGPCPPSGTHRYFFKVYALNDLLKLPEGASRREVEEGLRYHIIAYGELMGVYSRVKEEVAD
ncbi:YbhB/YbcL family Raf kinase inhibitor-like protein [Echinicola jeungdonensis]|uniref:YbhB/YbcL family Raf kinase inhibitor-like protein n=2 Tax=Echinicola jeungdonensis TaxID=709343 RepID=A0ABV5J958_9BACT|nr:YbhB/YbcL family Raf kinase inhibitor-like protein [Echinicola jeungdonensis]MDN3670535.1 YbhB/YbcL family Raf kinase inhibitor-like protein [Echinicola jeungdonensis]